MPAPKIFEMQIALYTVDNDGFSENRRGVCGGGGGGGGWGCTVSCPD